MKIIDDDGVPPTGPPPKPDDVGNEEESITSDLKVFVIDTLRSAEAAITCLDLLEGLRNNNNRQRPSPLARDLNNVIQSISEMEDEKFL